MPEHSLAKLNPRIRGSSLVNVIVETPAGSRNKYKYDEQLGLFMLHKMLPVGAAFPFDFGFIPGTRAEDGDALDIMLVGTDPTFVGCLITVRLLGVLEANQTERGETIRNDRLIGTAETEKIHPRERSLNDLPAKLLDEIEHFFVSYNRAEGRKFVSLGRCGPAFAAKRVDEAAKALRAPRRRSPARRSRKSAAR